MTSRFLPLAAAITLALSFSVAATSNQRGLDKANFDTSTAACADFYQFANGNWMKNNPIPDAYSSWGMMNELSERNLDVLKQILEAAKNADSKPGSVQQKIGDFYAAAMDETSIEKAGFEPIRSDLAEIDALKDRAGLATLINRWHANRI